MTTHRFVFSAAWAPASRATVSQRPSMTRYDTVSVIEATFSAFKRWYRYRKTVTELRGLEDRLLQDVGLRRSDVAYTARTLAENYDSNRPRT